VRKIWDKTDKKAGGLRAVTENRAKRCTTSVPAAAAAWCRRPWGGERGSCRIC